MSIIKHVAILNSSAKKVWKMRNFSKARIGTCLIYIVFMAMLLLQAGQAHAVSIIATGISRISGTECGIATYRISTDTSYNGQSIDLLLEITAEDNDLSGNCVRIDTGNIQFAIKDNDGSGSREGWMEATVTVVRHGSVVPVAVDRLVVSGFDLDDNGQSGEYRVKTDDMYFFDPNASFLSLDTNVTYSEGTFFGGQYNVKFKGQPQGDCNDSQVNPDRRCRASSIFLDGPSVNFRVQNDDAYSHTNNQNAQRWFFVSFRVENLGCLMCNDRDYGDASNSYPSTSQKIDGYRALGNGLPPDGEYGTQFSVNADGDDNDKSGNAIMFDDEDGVSLNGETLSDQNLHTDTTVNLDISTFGSGYLNGWIDWNGDGDFNDYGEKVINRQHIINNGETYQNGEPNFSASNAITNTVVPISVPWNAATGQTVARFKFTENRNPGYSGNSSTNGEVEDYQLTIISSPIEPTEVACYGASDATDELVLFDLDNLSTTVIGSFEVDSVEALKFNTDYSKLFAFNENQLGTVNEVTGVFTALPNTVSEDGSADGNDGWVDIYDIDAMSFDPITGELYAAVRENKVSGNRSILVKIDSITGKFIPNAFGADEDYVIINTNGLGGSNDLDDIDGLSIDSDGILFAIANNSGGNDRLVIIDKTDGSVTDRGAFNNGSSNVEDLEGLSFFPDGKLYAASGSTNEIFEVNKTNAHLTEAGTFSEGDDFEGLTCKDKRTSINGHLYLDSNGNGSQDAGEPDLAGVDVLVTDVNGATQTVTTDATGNYTATVPPGATTTNVDENDPDYPVGSSGKWESNEGSDPTTTTAVAGANTFTENDGYYVPAQVNGHLYLDSNGNGSQDAGEPDLAGVDVLVTDVNGATQTVTTDATGNYTATVPPGATTTNVDENDPDYPVGSTQSEGSDPTTTTAVAGANTFTENDGYYVPAQVNGHLYLDSNGNGSQDAGEPDLAGVDVLVTDVNGATQTVTTDATGNYTATVPPGATTTNVDENDPDYPVGSTQSEGSDPTTTTAVAGANTFTENDGYYVPAQVNGHLYLDSNGNGSQDAGEPDLAGVDVLVTDVNGATQTVTTDATGNYTATVPPGATTTNVDENDPDYPVGSTQSEGSDPTTTTAVAGANTFTENDGYYVPAQVNGHLYLDSNGNGSQDAGEPDLAGVDVLVTDVNGATQTVTTDATGNYTATVPPGATTTNVDENDPDYPVGSTQSEGSDPTTTTAVAGANTFTENDGYFVPAQVNGHLYLDSNGNGSQDAGEPDLAGVDVLVTDVNGATQTVTTDATGNYTATVPPGATTTNVDENDPDYPVGSTQSEGSDPTTTTAVAGANTFTENDGYFVPAQVNGHLYLDSNGNGSQDAGEPDLAGVDVLVTDVNGATQTVTTDATGNYTATVPPGATTTNVDENDPDYPVGSTQSEGSDPTTTTAVAGANTFTENDGYYVPAQVNGHLYLDSNGNGSQDAGEPDLAGVDVLVTDVNGATQTVTTDATGNYTATVPPGATTTNVDENDPDYPVGSTQSEGSDPTTTTAVAGANTFTENDGYYVPAQVNGHLYLDSNGNGSQDAGEPDLAGVDVLVTDVNGATQTVTTDATGNYTATVPPGATTTNVDENDPDYPVGSTQSEGSDPTTTTAVAGANTFTENDGYFVPAQVNGHLYLDSNGNGSQDAGEPDLAGVDVLVTDVNGATQTVTTDATGNYTATVPPGATTTNVDENDPDYPVGSTQSEGSDPTTTTAVAGANTFTENDGYFVPAQVNGHLYLDSNGNGSQDAGEPDLAGVDVLVTDVNGATQTVTTDATGNYTATVPPGATTTNVDENDPDYPVGSTQSEGSDPTTTTAVAGANTFTENDGYYVPAQVNGHLYLDSNGNGSQDAGEPDLAGVDVLVTDVNGATQTVTTDATGNYTATVPPGATTTNVDENDPDYPVGSTQSEGSDPTTTTAVAGANTFTENDGYYVPAQVNGHLYLDSNGNGSQDAGEPDLAGVDVLVTDVNGATQTVTTDATGNYTATVPPGATTTNVDENDPDYPVGSTQSEGSDPTTTTAVAGANTFTENDGYYVPAQVNGHLYLDSNGNGSQDAGEPDLAGVDVLVTDVNGATQTVTTDATGNYTATVPPGATTTNVDENDPDYPVGSTQSEGSDPTTTTAVAGANTFTENDGYYVPAQVNGHLYLDSNGNGSQDAGEPDLAGVDVLVTDVNGATQTVTTDATGNYTATVPPGATTTNVDENDPDYPVGSTQSEGSDPTTTTAVAGANTFTENDGYYVPAQVNGHLYLDSNDNGSQDAGEPDLAGVDVLVTDVNGATQTVTTDATGNYTATVPPGATTTNVDENDPDYPVGSTQSEGSDPTTTTAVAGANTFTENDGYFVPAQVNGHLYLDSNGNGSQDAGEPDLAGVDVLVTDVNGATQTVTTDATGNYTATVPPGATTTNVDENDPDYPVGSTQSEGSDPTTTTAVAGANTFTENDGYFVSLPSIEIIKSLGAIADSNGNGVTDSGDTITYSFVVTNTGNLVLNPVSVTDTKVNPVTCAAATLAVGANTTCSGTYVITPADMSAGGVENVATATGTPINPDGSTGTPVTDLSDAGTNPDGTPVPNPETTETPSPLGENSNNPGDPTDDPTTVALTPIPSIEIIKSLGSIADSNGNGVTDSGDTITYSFLVTNTGNLVLNPVSVTDIKVNPVTCAAATLAVGANTTCSGTYVITPADMSAGGVENVATATGTPINPDGSTGTPVTDLSDAGTNPDGTPVPNPETIETPSPLGENSNNPGDPTDDPTTVALTPIPSIEIIKSLGSIADSNGNGVTDSGDTITYSFLVTNTGNLVLNPVSVTDTKVNPVTCAAATLAVGANTTCSGTYVITPADMSAGGVENVATATGTPINPDGSTGTPVTDLSDAGTNPDGTPVPNPETTETPSPLGENTNNPGDPTDDPTTVALTPIPSIEIIKSLGAIADSNGNGVTDSGDTITYSFVVTNTGNLVLNPVSVTDTKVNPVTCAAATLAVGANTTCSGTYVITPADMSAGGVENVATATGTPINPDGSTGTPVTDLSDAGTNPDGTPVPNPETTETPSPLGENSNNPGDPTDDPTTVVFPPGVVAGTIYEDTNGNGVQDPGEPGISGVDVVITDTNGVSQTLTTDENGNYATPVPAGSTTIDIDETTLPTGFTQTEGTDVSTVIVPSGGIASDVDGYEPPADAGLVEGVVYEDTDGNGQQDPGEPGISGVTVSITDSAGNTQTLTTDENGEYSATVPPGNTTVDIDETTVPGGSTQTEGDDPTVVNVPVNGVGTDVDGFEPPADSGTVTGVIYEDTNGNGVQDSGEPGIPGVEVEVTDSAGNTQTVTTDADGNYTATVPAGETTLNVVDETLPGGSTQTQGTDVSTVTVPAGGTATDIDGYEPPADSGRLQGVVYEDTDGNGTQDAGEPGIEGVTVTVTDSEGNIHTLITDANGEYGVTVPAGDALVVIEQGDIDPTFTLTEGDDPTSVTVPAGGVGEDVDGFMPGGVVAGTVYEDTNGNGVQDPGEPGISGVDVVITDTNGVSQTLTTDENGNYATPVPAGSTTIDIDETTLPTGFTQTEGTDVSTVIVPSGGIASDVDGYEPPADAGLVEGVVYEDTDGNGQQDPGEPGISGVTVSITDSAGNTQTLTTDENGEYSATVPPGNTTVDIDETTVPGGSTQTEGDDPTVVNVPVNGVGTDVDGFEPPADSGTVTGVIYEDTNGNGVQDSGEPGIPGVEVEVTDSAGNTQTVTTDADGNYTATVPAGETTLNVVDETLPGGSTQTQGTDVSTVTVPAGGTATDIDGYEPPADSGRLQGVVYEDTDGNGTQDAGEPGIEGVTVTVTDSEGNIHTLITDTNGEYGVTVPAGDALVVIEQGDIDPTFTLTEGTDPTTVTVPAGGVGEDVDGFMPAPANPAIMIEKSTNGEDADTPAEAVKVLIPYGGTTVTWEYVVTNTGNLDLTDISVTDSQEGEICVVSFLAIGATETCTKIADAQTGDYANIGTVSGQPVDNTGTAVGAPIEDSDPSHYRGIFINIEKTANKTVVCPGDEVEYTMIVRLIGGVREGDSFRNIQITDSLQGILTPASPSFVASSDTNSNGYLDVLAGNIPEEFVWKYTMVVDQDVTNTAVDEGDFYEGEELIWHIINDKPSSVDVRTDPDLCKANFPWPIFMPAIISHINQCQPIPDFCYMIADGDNEGSIDAPLFKYTFETNKLELVNRLGVANVESIVISLDGETVYATNDGVFGTIDEAAGIQDSFSPIDPSSLDAGLGRGALGRIRIKDIDGLAFDPKSGILYGSNRLADGVVGGQQDLLVQLNPETGKIIPNAFGSGIDYVVIDAAAVGSSDIDDIAIDPSGDIYGIAGTSGGAGDDHLVLIDGMTGAVTDQGPLHFAGDKIQDMEGLTLYNNKTLFGTTGIEFDGQGTSNSLFKIEKDTGVTTFVTRLDQNFDGLVPGDFEAIECLPICK